MARVLTHMCMSPVGFDELCVSQVPVLFGAGIRYFGELAGGHVLLEDPVVVQGTRALHLRDHVRR